jgi:hypothetical protein
LTRDGRHQTQARVLGGVGLDVPRALLRRAPGCRGCCHCAAGAGERRARPHRTSHISQWRSGGFLIWLLLVPLGLYVFDRVSRALAGRRRARVHALWPASGGVAVLEYTLEGLNSYTPGQFLFVCVPCISALEWHPFTISSAPHAKRAGAPAARRGGDGAGAPLLQTMPAVSHHIKVCVCVVRAHCW